VRSTIRLFLSEPGYPDRAGLLQKIVTITRPAPILRSFHKTSGDRIAVHVLQLFDSLVMGEHIEVVITGLPERTLREAFWDRELEGLKRFGKRNLVVFRFTDEEVNMLRHDDVAEDLEVVPPPGLFERVEEDVSWGWGVELGFTTVAAEGDEVVVTFVVISLETERHGWV
jgi:hypothetical protein